MSHHNFNDVRGPSFFLPAGKGGGFFFFGGGGGRGGGSHGFQGEQREDQSSPTECKGETMKKLTANTLLMGEGKNIAEPLGGNQINFFRDTNNILQTLP